MNGHKNRRPDAERIPIDELCRRFEYKDGELRRTGRGRGTSKKTGSVNSLGYHRVKIDGKQYFSHHLVFAIHHGRWPKETDHIDRNRLNNRIENLREVTRKENQKNRGAYRWKASAMIRQRAGGMYAAHGKVKGRPTVFLGSFTCYVEALRARIMWMKDNGAGVCIP